MVTAPEVGSTFVLGHSLHRGLDLGSLKAGAFHAAGVGSNWEGPLLSPMAGSRYTESTSSCYTESRFDPPRRFPTASEIHRTGIAISELSGSAPLRAVASHNVCAAMPQTAIPTLPATFAGSYYDKVWHSLRRRSLAPASPQALLRRRLSGDPDLGCSVHALF